MPPVKESFRSVTTPVAPPTAAEPDPVVAVSEPTGAVPAPRPDHEREHVGLVLLAQKEHLDLLLQAQRDHVARVEQQIADAKTVQAATAELVDEVRISLNEVVGAIRRLDKQSAKRSDDLIDKVGDILSHVSQSAQKFDNLLEHASDLVGQTGSITDLMIDYHRDRSSREPEARVLSLVAGKPAARSVLSDLEEEGD